MNLHDKDLKAAGKAFMETIDLDKWSQENEQRYEELMLWYDAAIAVLLKRLQKLNRWYSLHYRRTLIRKLECRRKSDDSIADKVFEKGIPYTPDAIEQNIFDIAGIRAICPAPRDVYTLAELIMKQKDLLVLTVKDYINHPKENGYRSLHLIVKVPVEMNHIQRQMVAEIQIRTTAMDWWANLDHEMRYKAYAFSKKTLQRELSECADLASELDRKMDLETGGEF